MAGFLTVVLMAVARELARYGGARAAINQKSAA
jgi:hypothetical protein